MNNIAKARYQKLNKVLMKEHVSKVLKQDPNTEKGQLDELGPVVAAAAPAAAAALSPAIKAGLWALGAAVAGGVWSWYSDNEAIKRLKADVRSGRATVGVVLKQLLGEWWIGDEESETIRELIMVVHNRCKWSDDMKSQVACKSLKKDLSDNGITASKVEQEWKLALRGQASTRTSAISMLNKIAAINPAANIAKLEKQKAAAETATASAGRTIAGHSMTTDGKQCWAVDSDNKPIVQVDMSKCGRK